MSTRRLFNSLVRPLPGARAARKLVRRVQSEVAWWRTRSTRADVAIFHQFAPPPSGGGHQFLRALWGEFERLGLRAENNTISPTTRGCLFNSFNFDPARLRRFQHSSCRLVHRVDGPVDLYRGRDQGVDRRIQRLNQEFADGTVFQSAYSLRAHQELGLDFRAPVVIHNTPDSALFHSRGRTPFDPGRKLRIIASSWSDNPNKGAPVYQWLEDHLDWDRFDFTFVGRSPVRFQRIRHLPPVPSAQVAELLRDHDIFMTASLHEPCSNALLEALACGLPALYVQSGSHGELVGEAGLGFATREEIPGLLDQLVSGYARYQAAIRVPPLAEVAAAYLAAMGIEVGG